MHQTREKRAFNLLHHNRVTSFNIFYECEHEICAFFLAYFHCYKCDFFVFVLVLLIMPYTRDSIIKQHKKAHKNHTPDTIGASTLKTIEISCLHLMCVIH